MYTKLVMLLCGKILAFTEWEEKIKMLFSWICGYTFLYILLKLCFLVVIYSEFADIYDEDHFTSTLKDFVTVVHDLPNELMELYNFSISNIPSLRLQAWSSARYYLDEVYPVLQETRYKLCLRCILVRIYHRLPTQTSLCNSIVNTLLNWK